jgi:hypothetical protein
MYNCTKDKDFRQMTDPLPRQMGCPTRQKDCNSQTRDKVKSGHEPEKGLDTKIDWLTDCQL